MLTTTPISLLTLALELALVAGLTVGLGRIPLSVLTRDRLPDGWHTPLAAVAGIAMVNLAMQAWIAARWTSCRNIALLAEILVAVAVAGWACNPPRVRIRWQERTCEWRPHLPMLAFPMAAAAVNLIIAAAPSTRNDEIYYHMLTPERLIKDGALLAYLLPYEASALPHMQFQVSLAMAHAWGDCDLGNIVSAWLGILLVVFLYAVCREHTRSRPLSIMLASTVCVGLYAPVHHTASGPHALGDLALVMATITALKMDDLARRVGGWQTVLLISLCATAAASTKLSLWPVALLLTLAGAVRAREAGWHGALAAVLPWVVCQGPMMALSWHLTGSPFGPFFGGALFGAGPPAELAGVIADSRFVNQVGLAEALKDFFINVSPMLPLAVVALCWPRRDGLRGRLLLLVLLALQTLLVALFLPHYFRFLSGLLFAALAASAMHWADAPAMAFVERHARLAALILLGPWLCVQLYYAVPFVRVFTGSMSRQAFVDRYVALAADFRALDRLLPPEALLLADARVASVYAPRPVVFTPRDLRGRAPVYYLAVGEPLADSGALHRTSEVYRNPRAVVRTYRNPLSQPEHGFVGVYTCAPR